MTTRHPLCEPCRRGYSPSVERYDRLAVRADGPSFLWRCKLCGALRDEQLRYAKLVSREEALASYPDAQV